MQPVTNRVTWSVGRSVCHSSEPCKMDEPIEMPFGVRSRMGPRNRVLEGGPDVYGKGQFWGKRHPLYACSISSFCCELCNFKRLGCGLGWAQRSRSSIVFARWRQCALPYDWTVRLRRRCGLVSNYFDHLLLGRIAVLRRPTCDLLSQTEQRSLSDIDLSVTIMSRTKWLKRSRCRLGCGLRWAQRTMWDGGSDPHRWRG